VVTDGPKAANQTHEEDTRPTLGDTLAGIGDLFHAKDYWIISLGTFCRYGVFAAFQALWAGPFLMNVMGLSAVTTGNMIFLLSIGLILGGPMWGIISDRILHTRKGVVICGLAGFSSILLAIAFLPASVNQAVLYALFFVCGIFSSAGMVMYSHIKERVPLNKAGAAMTGINFFTMAGAAVFLQGLGAIMQHFFPVNTLGPGAFQTAFIVCSVCLGATALLYLQTGENRKNHVRV
jgi:sugar phosphate permease